MCSRRQKEVLLLAHITSPLRLFQRIEFRRKYGDCDVSQGYVDIFGCVPSQLFGDIATILISFDFSYIYLILYLHRLDIWASNHRREYEKFEDGKGNIFVDYMYRANKIVNHVRFIKTPC